MVRRKQQKKTNSRLLATVAGAVTAILGSAAMLASAPAAAHTDSLGFLITPGSGNGLFNASIFYGSWHGGGVAAEGALDLFRNSSLLSTQTFAIVSGYGNVPNGTVPTGLVAGTNYFFPDRATTTAGDLSGDPTGHSIYAFQSAMFLDITPGLYTFAYNTGSVLSVNWATSDPAINAGSFTITSNGGLGSVGGVTPSSNDIDTAQGAYDASNLGGSLNPVFTGGTLNLDQDQQTFSQTFSLDDSGTSSVDLEGHSNTITGVFNDATGVAGSIILTDSASGGSLTLAGANTHTGGTTINSGTVQLAGAGTLGAASGSTTVAGGTLDLGGTSQVQASVAQSGGLIEEGVLTVGTYQMTGGTLAVNASVTASTLFNLQQGTVHGELEGAALLAKSGSGSVVLTGVNTYVGGTTITAGTLIGTASSFGAGAIANDASLVIDEASNVSVANAISGSGSLTKLGTGTVTLAATNSHAGGTVIDAGALEGNSASFGSGAIVNNAQLTLVQSVDATFANVLDGSGGFSKIGSGSLNMTGTGLLSGNTVVAGGRLAMNGSLAASHFTVQDGAVLGGNGTVGTLSAASGAVVAPGNSIGTLQVAGDYTPAAGSIYEVELDSTGASDRIEATGQTVIADGALLDVVKMDNATPYVLGTRYTVLTAVGGVAGDFTLTGDTAVSAFYSVVDTYGANSVWLDVAQTASFAALGQTPNQRAAAAGVNSLGVGTPLFNAIGFLQSAEEARPAFELLSGEVHASLKTSVLGSGRLARTAANDRARMSLDGLAAANGAALATNPECASTGATADCPVVWMQALGSWGSVDGKGNAARLESSDGGLLLGTDVQAGSWRLGALAGVTDDSFDVDARRSSGSNKAFHLGAYGSKQWGPLGLRVGATYAWNDIATQRALSFTGFSDTLKAEYGIDSVQVFGELGYHLNLGNLAFEPFLEVAYAKLDAASFTEEGGAAALHSVVDSMDTTTSTLGLRMAGTLTLGSVEALTRIIAGWQHGYSNQTPEAILAFSGGSGFAVTGVAAAADAAVIEAGADFRLSRRGTFSLAYSGQLASDAEEHGVKASLNFAF